MSIDTNGTVYLDPVSPLSGIWERKCWGWTRCVFNSPHVLVFELHTLAGWQCSRHYHNGRSNRFVVISGRIGVVTEGGSIPGNYLLHAGDAIDVHPLFYHRFQSFEPSLLLEIYYSRDGSPINISDIVRDENNLGCPIEKL